MRRGGAIARSGTRRIESSESNQRHRIPEQPQLRSARGWPFSTQLHSRHNLPNRAVYYIDVRRLLVVVLRLGQLRLQLLEAMPEMRTSILLERLVQLAVSRRRDRILVGRFAGATTAPTAAIYGPSAVLAAGRQRAIVPTFCTTSLVVLMT